MLGIHFDLRRFENDLDAALDAIHDGAERGLDRSGDVLLGHKRRRMQAGTYARPERVGPDGAKEWERSGDWMDGQTVQKTGDLKRNVTTEGRAEAYEKRLANLSTGPDGINRTNNAAGDAARIFEPQFGPTMEEGINSELRARGLNR